MNLIRKQWFLISLIVMMVVGFCLAQPLERLADQEWMKWLIVSVTMFLMAWPLEFGRLKRAFSRPLAPGIACVMNLVLIPLLIWPLAALVGAELGPGMIIAAATPSTLASASVLTRRAGGDDSISIMVTILTNATCFLVMPFWILVQTGNEIQSSKLVGTIYKLLLFVVLPIAVAQVARMHRDSATWATESKPRLSVLALIGILSIVLIGSIKMGLRFSVEGDSTAGSGFNIWQLIGAATILLAVHTIVLWTGILTAKQLGIPREEQIAVGFSGSQKTLMIGLSTAINLGMSIVPIVMYHALQLLVDAYFAARSRDAMTLADTSTTPP
ncbi:MAG: bile acid:sodium symporter family protein [Mariniblastus sp.]